MTQEYYVPDFTVRIWDSQTKPRPFYYTGDLYYKAEDAFFALSVIYESCPVASNPYLDAFIKRLTEEVLPAEPDSDATQWLKTNVMDNLQDLLQQKNNVYIELTIPDSVGREVMPILAKASVPEGLYLYGVRIFDSPEGMITDAHVERSKRNEYYYAPDGTEYPLTRQQKITKYRAYKDSLTKRGIHYPYELPKRRKAMASLLVDILTPLLAPYGFTFKETIVDSDFISIIYFDKRPFGHVAIDVSIRRKQIPFNIGASLQYFCTDHIPHFNKLLPNYGVGPFDTAFSSSFGSYDIEVGNDLLELFWFMEQRLPYLLGIQSRNDVIEYQLNAEPDGQFLFNNWGLPEDMMIYRLAGRPDYKELAQRSYEKLDDRFKPKIEPIFDKLMAYLETMEPLETPETHLTYKPPTNH